MISYLNSRQNSEDSVMELDGNYNSTYQIDTSFNSIEFESDDSITINSVEEDSENQWSYGEDSYNSEIIQSPVCPNFNIDLPEIDCSLIQLYIKN